jgi:hypothetical protein
MEIMLTLVVPMLLAICGFLLVWLLKTFSTAQEKQDDAIKELDRRQNEVLATLPLEYVRREEFTLMTAKLDAKLDRMLEVLESLPCKGGDRGKCASR